MLRREEEEGTGNETAERHGTEQHEGQDGGMREGAIPMREAETPHEVMMRKGHHLTAHGLRFPMRARSVGDGSGSRPQDHTGMLSPNTQRASRLCGQPSLLRGPSHIPPLLYPVLPLPCGHCHNECPSPAGDGCEWRPTVLATNSDVERADKPEKFRAYPGRARAPHVHAAAAISHVLSDILLLLCAFGCFLSLLLLPLFRLLVLYLPGVLLFLAIGDLLVLCDT